MIKTARKEYECMAWIWLSNDEPEPGQFTFSELRSIAKAKINHGKILKGEKYLWARVFSIDTYGHDRFPITFRAIPEIDAICKKYDIYQYV